VKVGLTMPKGGEMHLRMPFLLIWQGNKLLLHGISLYAFVSLSTIIGHGYNASLFICQICSISLLPNLCVVSKSRLMEEPAAYGKFGLANLLELREECLREFQFVDAYISIKQRLASFLYMGSCTKTCSYLSDVLIFSA
jgi:hypothetical protein